MAADLPRPKPQTGEETYVTESVPPVDPGVAGALTRYRVMAYVTGSFLLLLTTTTLVKYIGLAVGWENETFSSVHTIIGIVHGWIFVVYFLTCVHLWLLKKWRIGRLAAMVFGGVVPVLSFVVERRIRREVTA